VNARGLALGCSLLVLGCSHAPVAPGEGEPDALLDAGTADGGSAPGTCTRFGAPVRTGNNPAVLPELSGLAARARNAGISWAHNDSGNALELFALREDGSVAARIPLTGATNIDVEDIAVGPCAEGSCVFLADIGDNKEVRGKVHLYRLPEPELLEDTPRAVVDLPFRYADRAHNAEALVVDPATGTPWIITKGLFTLGDVYRVEGLAPGSEGVAVKLGALQNPAFDQLTTAADAHPTAPEVLVRSYGRVWLYRAPAGGTLEQALLSAPVELPAPSQPQSEAIAWLPGGSGYLVGTEGAGEGLFRVECAP
jgi:hypothetical protein